MVFVFSVTFEPLFLLHYKSIRRVSGLFLMLLFCGYSYYLCPFFMYRTLRRFLGGFVGFEFAVTLDPFVFFFSLISELVSTAVHRSTPN